MSFDKYIVKYLRSSSYTKWSILGVLEYLAKNIEYTSGSFKDICHAFKEELENIAEDSNTLAAAKRKATKICNKLETTMERDIIIQHFLENQDLKLSQNRYRTKVELSVVTDKTTIVDMSSGQFAALARGDRNLEDSDVRGEHNGTESEKAHDLEDSDAWGERNGTKNEKEREENQEKAIEDIPEGSMAEERRILVKNILEDSMVASPAEEAVANIFFKDFPGTMIMDLRPKSKFSLILDSVIQEEVLHEVFNHIDDYITNEIHEYLTAFFNEDHGFQGWSDAVDNIISTDCDSELLAKTKKLIKETLPKYFKAFSLAALNPLRDITTLEKVHLNQFVHPVIDSALWIFAKVNYVYGEIPLGLKTKLRADGVGFLNDVVNYPIVCGEGARPGALQQKNVDDDVKNASNMAALYNQVVISEANARRHLFTDLKIYGLTAFKTDVSLTMMDFRSMQYVKYALETWTTLGVDIFNFRRT